MYGVRVEDGPDCDPNRIATVVPDWLAQSTSGHWVCGTHHGTDAPVRRQSSVPAPGVASAMKTVANPRLREGDCRQDLGLRLSPGGYMALHMHGQGARATVKHTPSGNRPWRC